MPNLTTEELQDKIKDFEIKINTLAQTFEFDTGFYPYVDNVTYTTLSTNNVSKTNALQVSIKIK